QPAAPDRIETQTIILSVVAAVPIAIISIPVRLVWLLVVLVKSLYLLADNRRMEAANSLECFWKNTLTLILLPFRVYSFLSPARRNVVNSPNYVNLADVDVTDSKNIPPEFNPTRVGVISAAASFSESIWNFTGKTDETTWPSMDGATCQEMDRNFTSEEAAAAGIIDPNPNDPRPIRPLFIGVRGTLYAMDTYECMCNFFGGLAENFAPIESFVAKVQRTIDEKNAALTEYRYVPVVVGHSMGGALASGIAVEKGISSITFNSMGWGNELYRRVGRDALRTANTTNAQYHINISVAGCHVSDPSAFIFQQVPLRTIHLPNCTELAEIHMRIKDTWEAYCREAGLSGVTRP
ncbi:MAG: lipase family protein, partial [Puniceicoccales bacterium]|nr:lipase family protein [Puniceicoccales bacterium]